MEAPDAMVSVFMCFAFGSGSVARHSEQFHAYAAHFPQIAINSQNVEQRYARATAHSHSSAKSQIKCASTSNR